MKLTRRQLSKLIQEVFIGSGPVDGQEYDEDKEFDPPYDPKPVFKSGKRKLKKSLADLGYEQGSDLFDSDDPANVASGIALASSFGEDNLTKQERDVLDDYPQNIKSSLKDDPYDKYAWKHMDWDDYLHDTPVYGRMKIATRKAVKQALSYLESMKPDPGKQKFSRTMIKDMTSPLVDRLHNLTSYFFEKGNFQNQYHMLEDTANYLAQTRGIDAFGDLYGLKDALFDEEIALAVGISPDYPTPKSMKSKYSIVKSNKRS